MTLLELIVALLKTKLSSDSLVCVSTKDGSTIPIHIDKVEEDPDNTGIITIYLSKSWLHEDEVGYK